MKIQVLFFSVLRDATETAETTVEVEPATTVAGLLGLLYARWPGLRAWDASLLTAVDQAYVRRDAELHENAEVAIMPPVQGG
jgi:molybdopterin converting factor small subunit